MKHILIFLILLISIESLAQSNFNKGYIITTELDTIYGEIDNSDYYSNSQYCDFKDLKNTVIRFFPDKIFGYRFIDGKYYVSKEINGNKLFLEYLIK